jgi:hypothetical protein
LDGDFASKLKTVLSDPEAMAKISAIASNLGNVPADQPQRTEPPKQETPSFSPDLLSIHINQVRTDLKRIEADSNGKNQLEIR